MADIMVHPSVSPWISDDMFAALDRESIAEALQQSRDHMLATYNGLPMGSFSYIRRNAVMAEVHSAVLPQFRGKLSEDAARESLRIAFESLGYSKVITWVPDDNRPALALAKRVGMVDEGHVSHSYLRQGKLLGQSLLGITREEFLCR